MSFADIRIVAITLILAVTYGTFLFLNANTDNSPSYDAGGINESEYNTPSSGTFFSQLEAVGTMHMNNPELFFIDSILFGTIAFLLVFVGLRFLRGTG